jgi:4-hydroxy-3-methylbut-2-enyl diphosphate reductase
MEQVNLEMKRKKLNIYLANPRGFCAGVERAIAIVEKALEKYGPPIYIKHEIVHNKYVVDNLRDKGAVFVEDISEIPEGALSIYSAHGVSKKVEEDAKEKGLTVYDATCPLVKKVHNQIVKFDKSEREIIMIGHKGHPEVEGTSGRIDAEIYLVQNISEAKKLEIKDPKNVSFITQTTLSVDDTKKIIDVLKIRFPDLEGPNSDDICYATQNRQDAVKDLVKYSELLLVIGANNSSNSNRLRDIGEESKISSYLISDEKDIDLKWFENVANVGITAGASAPEILVEGVIDFLRDNFLVTINNVEGKKENIIFNIPKELR